MGIQTLKALVTQLGVTRDRRPLNPEKFSVLAEGLFTSVTCYSKTHSCKEFEASMTTALSITTEQKNLLLKFLKKNRNTDLVTIYLAFIEEKYKLKPVLFPRDKTIYQSLDNLIDQLTAQGKLWRETEITIQFGQQSVNEETKKIYICPFTGKVFADNTHPNPQDAIYDWVAKCPENKERIGGLPVKRFFVSEDPAVIKNYITERKSSVKKVVYSSAITGKLFNSKNAIIEDFKKNHIKSMSLLEVQNQNRFQLEEHFLNFIQTYLTEDKIAQFVEAISSHPEFQPFLEKWVETE